MVQRRTHRCRWFVIKDGEMFLGHRWQVWVRPSGDSKWLELLWLVSHCSRRFLRLNFCPLSLNFLLYLYSLYHCMLFLLVLSIENKIKRPVFYNFFVEWNCVHWIECWNEGINSRVTVVLQESSSSCFLPKKSKIKKASYSSSIVSSRILNQSR